MLRDSLTGVAARAASLRSAEWPFSMQPALVDSTALLSTGGTRLHVLVAAIAAGAALLLSGNHLWQLFGSARAGPAPRWSALLTVVVSAPSAVAALSFAQAALTHAWVAPLLLQCLYEAVAIWCLLELFLAFIGGSKKDVLAVLEEADPQRIWAAPPFCCLAVLPGSAPKVATAWDLNMVKALVLQYCVVSLILGVCEAVRGSQGHFPPMAVFVFVRLPSLAGLFYGFFALFRAGRVQLAARRCHGKFWMLKGLIVLQLVVRRVAWHAGGGTERARVAGCLALAVLAVAFAVCTPLVYTPDDLDALRHDALLAEGKSEREPGKPSA